MDDARFVLLVFGAAALIVTGVVVGFRARATPPEEGNLYGSLTVGLCAATVGTGWLGWALASVGSCDESGDAAHQTFCDRLAHLAPLIFFLPVLAVFFAGLATRAQRRAFPITAMTLATIAFQAIATRTLT